MHIETAGAGPDLVMIHGWAMHAGIFAPLTRLLAPRFRLHLVDLPGHGFSRDDSGSLDPAECARRIAAATPRAIWLGWSLGGLVAMRAALDAPAQVRALVPIASSPRFVVGDAWSFGIAPTVLAEFGAGLARDYRATIERFLALEAMGSDHARAELRELRSHAFERGQPAVSALENGMRVLEGADLRDGIARIAMPSLWIAGRRDRLVDPSAMRWSAERCNGRFVACDSGHAPFLAHAGVLADALAAFAAELEA
ncbi:MAG TPA: pimeloyl-ACP methyl ester esterase BioH [Rhodanobacteraceae bacterium]|nr:pimeloyl-ACP methyl ester esterase BioH [Rhodanobacteraceae bacterium]